MASSSLWQRFQQYFLRYDDLGFSIDISRMKFPDGFFDQMRPKIEKAFSAMRDLKQAELPIPTKNEWLVITGYANPRWRQIRSCAPRLKRQMRSSRTLPPKSIAGKSETRAAKNFNTCFQSGLGDRRSDRNSSPKRLGQRRTRWTFISSITRIQMDSIACWTRSTMNSHEQLSWRFRSQAEQKKRATECWRRKRASRRPAWILRNMPLPSPALEVISTSMRRKTVGWRVSRCGIGLVGEPPS